MKKIIIFPILALLIFGCSLGEQKEDILVLKNQISEISSQMETLMHENKELKQENKNLETENNQLKEKIKEKENSKDKTVDFVNFFLANNPDDFDYDNLNKYFVSVKGNLENPVSSTEDKILYSLKKLFEIKEFNYGEYKNYLYESDLKVKNITNENGKIIVNLEGKIVGIGSVADIFIKPQITKTIEEYTKNYIIKINNSESEWKCSLDNSGLCE